MSRGNFEVSKTLISRLNNNGVAGRLPSTMKNRKILLVPFLAFFLCGCFEVRQEIVINKNGGGKIIETFMMSKSVINQLNSLFSDLPSSKKQKSQKMDIYDKEKLKKDASNYGPDVKYVSSKKMSTKTKEGYQVEYAFKDINDLKINQNPGDKGPKASGAKSNAQEENITFKFKKDDPAELIVSFPEKVKPKKEKKKKKVKKDKEAEQKEMEGAREMFKDFYIGITIRPEGEIVETDATYREGNTITILEMDFNKLLADEKQFESFAKKEPETIEETKTLLKNIPGFKVELNKTVVIKFK